MPSYPIKIRPHAIEKRTLTCVKVDFERVDAHGFLISSQSIVASYMKREIHSHLICRVFEIFLYNIETGGSSMATTHRLFSELDQMDIKILEVVTQEGRISITDLAERVGLSKTPCQLRLKKLVEDSYIDGFAAILNPSKLGLDHVAFAEVKLTHTHENALTSFNAAVKKIKEVEECHMIAGRFDYLLKIRTRDIRVYRHVLGERISALPFVASTSTNVAMETVKESRGNLFPTGG
jgi:Lrp/AsnC family leucine-responsive transcriptional regulator